MVGLPRGIEGFGVRLHHQRQHLTREPHQEGEGVVGFGGILVGFGGILVGFGGILVDFGGGSPGNRLPNREMSRPHLFQFHFVIT